MGGRHEYDGMIQDLSPDGSARGWRAWARAPQPADPHDAAHRGVFEEACGPSSASWSCTAATRSTTWATSTSPATTATTPPRPERAAAKPAHLAHWPDAVDARDRLARPASAPRSRRALLGAVRGLAAGIPADATRARAAALTAHARLVAHVEQAAAHRRPGRRRSARTALARLMGAGEGLPVDLGELAERADAERDRLTARLPSPAPGSTPDGRRWTSSRELVRHHPGTDGVIEAARLGTERGDRVHPREATWCPTTTASAWSACAPESRRWAMAMMSLGRARRAGRPVLVPHHPARPVLARARTRGVAGGVQRDHAARDHRARGRPRALLARPGAAPRAAPTSAGRCTRWRSSRAGRTTPRSSASRRASRADDPRFAIGVWLEALVRVTRLACAIGVHTGAMTVEDGARRFEADTHLARSGGAVGGAPGHLRPDLRPLHLGQAGDHRPARAARPEWGAGFRSSASTRAMLDLGSPPLGLLGSDCLSARPDRLVTPHSPLGGSLGV